MYVKEEKSREIERRKKKKKVEEEEIKAEEESIWAFYFCIFYE